MKCIPDVATLLALGSLVIAPAPAQDGELIEKNAATEEVAASPGQQEFDALQKEADEAYREWRMAVRKASEEEREELFAQDPMAPFLARFQAGAAKYAGQEAAVPFLVWIVQWGGRMEGTAGTDSFMTLLTTHAKSPALAGMASMLPDYDHIAGEQAPQALAAIQTIAKENPDKKVQGWATFAVHQKTLQEGELGSEAYDQAKAAVIAKARVSGDDWLVRQAKSTIGIREQFSIGMVAPDIQALDLDGVEFRLSDYRGRVVFVDFWGDW